MVFEVDQIVLCKLFLGKDDDEEIVDRTEAEEHRERLHVALAMPLDIVAHHVARTPEELGTGAQDAAVEVGDEAHDVVYGIEPREATCLGALAATRAIEAGEAGAAVLAAALGGGHGLAIEEARVKSIDLQDAQESKSR